MKPTQIELKNFMSYRHAKLDLSKQSVLAIVGPNGAGKSTILEAITYALWGQARAKSPNDLVLRGESQCSVLVEFMVGEQKYRVTRRRQIGTTSTTSLEFAEVYDPPEDKLLPLTESTIKDTQEAINAVLGISFDVFVNSVFLRQGDASRFSEARPGERKELLGTMLGLDQFAELEARARKKARLLDVQIETIDAVLGSKTDETRALQDAHSFLANAEYEVKECQGEVDELRHLAKEAEGKLQALLVIAASTEGMIERHADLGKQAAEEIGHNDNLRLKYVENQRIIDHASTIMHRKKSFDKLQELDGVLNRKQQIYAKAQELQHKIELEKSTLVYATRDLDALKNTVKENQEELHLLDQQLAPLLAELYSAEEQYAALSGETKGLAERRVKEANELNKIDAQIKGLLLQHDLIGDTSTCPVCQSEITDRESLEEHYTRENERLEKLFDVQDKASYSADVALQENQEAAQIVYEEVATMKAERTEIELKASTASRRLEEFTGKLKEAQEAQDRLNAKDYAHEEHTLLEDLGPVDYDSENHQEVKKRLELIKDAPEQFARLGEINTQQATLTKELGESDDKIRALQERIASLDEEISKATDEGLAYGHEDELQGEIEGLTRNIDTLEKTTLKVARESLATWQEKVNRKKELEEEMVRLQKEYNERAKELKVSKTLVDAVSKKGAPALIIESFLPTIERDANDYLELMSPGITVTLDSQRITQSGNASETLDINVYNNGHTAPIETLSGGERFRADLALRLAIGKALSRKSGTQARMLCIDEGFGSQDPDGQEAVVGTIVNLSDAFDLIVLITHIESVAKAVGTIGNVLEVGKSKGASVLL